jgi:hypothetical protein
MSYDTLKIKRAEALALINQQIQKGDALFEKGYLLIEGKSDDNISSRDRDIFESTFKQWVDITYSTLLRVFTSSKYALEFNKKHSIEVEYVNSSWIPDIKYYLGKELAQKLEYLGMLKDSINDFREEYAQPAIHKKDSEIAQVNPTKLKSIENKEDTIWQQIKNDYGIDKRALGKKISFVTDTFKRKIIFRDIEHAYFLAGKRFSKPAVILAGGVIEELLRLYLQTKAIRPDSNNFEGYIKACQNNGLLKLAISQLTHYVRYFRNFVHLEKETSRDTISEPIAKGAVASIFTVVNNFE